LSVDFTHSLRREELPEERTTQYLIETLGDDIDHCHASLIDQLDHGEVYSDGGVYAD
jgi:hypothetical protein